MGAMSTGDERLESVGESIEEAKKAADKVSDQEDLELRHREEPDATADHGAGEDIDDADDESPDDKPADSAGEAQAGEAQAGEDESGEDESGEDESGERDA
jgi:hypothetical protein